jgi:hypothetical protein
MDERLRFRRKLLQLAVLAVVSLHWTTAVVVAGGTAVCCPLRAQDQLWLVSDRSLGCNVECEAERLQYWRYDCQRCWTHASLDELLAAEDPAMPTIVFLHGNRIPSDEAFTKGWSAYRTLVRCADERPVRFIIWSWPSDPIRGPIQDARVKAGRTNITGYYLAWFLDRLSPEAPIGLWAHSFGARAVTGALHLLGGGQLAGHVLNERVHPERAPAQVALLAAALDNHWLLPGHCHGQAITQTSELLLVNNSCDALLKRYHFLYHRRSCQEALGYTGMNAGYLGDEAVKVQQIDAACQVGKQHLFALYLQAPVLMARIRATLLPGEVIDAEPQASPAATTSDPELVQPLEQEAKRDLATEVVSQ